MSRRSVLEDWKNILEFMRESSLDLSIVKFVFLARGNIPREITSAGIAQVPCGNVYWIPVGMAMIYLYGTLEYEWNREWNKGETTHVWSLSLVSSVVVLTISLKLNL